MAIVFACIAPHGGNLLLGSTAPTPIPQVRAAMTTLHQELVAAQPDAVAIITPHGIYLEGSYTLIVSPTAEDQQGIFPLVTETDLDLTATWAYRASEMGVPVTPVIGRTPEEPLPLDWGVTIPLALLTPPPMSLPVAVACPARDLTRAQLIDWGEALAIAAEELGKRVALIVSADQGHGHAADGPYGFASESAEYDQAMIEVIQNGDLTKLLDWNEDWIEAALADSYWQTLALIGVQKRVPLRSRFLAYQVDHYFGLLCASFLPS